MLCCNGMRRCVEDSASLKAWRLFHYNIVLPPSARHHTHKWDIIDSGVAGCLLCGTLHICGDGCVETEEVSDGLVCSITGLYVHNKHYVQEFSENVSIDDETRVAINYGIQDRHVDIEHCVNYLLLSPAAQKAFMRDFRRWRQHRQQKIDTGPCNLVKKVCACAEIRQSGLLNFNRDLRVKLANNVSKLLNHVLSILIQVLRLEIKDCDFYGFVAGVCFLMKAGVFLDGVTILPQSSLMQKMLPSESSLALFDAIKAKNITDAENRFKFVLREIDVQYLKKQGFDLENNCDLQAF